MSRGNVGDIPEFEADEDVDPDVEIAEREVVVVVKKSARQRIEDLLEEQEWA